MMPLPPCHPSPRPPLLARHRRYRHAAVLALGLCLWGCQPAQDQTPAAASSATSAAATAALAPGEIARSGSLGVSRAALDSFVLQRLRQERPAPGADLEQWYRERIREYVIEADLLQTARQQQRHLAEDFLQASAAMRRELETELCLRQQLSQLAPLQRSEVEAEFESHGEQFRRPERRLTLHYFRRAADATALAAAEAEVAALREQILQGEDFARLARAGSDSESRHRGGELGWLSRGELPAAIEAAVFALDEGVPSQPLSTADGVHLFLVQSISPARQATLTEVLPALRERMLLQRLEPVLQGLLQNDPRDFGMPGAEALATLLREDDGSTLLLEDGDYRFSVADFRQHLQRLAQRQADGGTVPPGDAVTLLGAVRNREKLRQVCIAEDLLERAEVDAAVLQWETQRLVEQQRRAALKALAQEDEARLRLYHSQNPDQFSTPLRFSLQRLRIPLDEQASATMAALERAAADGGQDLQQLQARHGGELDLLPEQRAAELRRIAPMLPALIAPLEVGQLSAPLRTREHLQIFRLQAREEPQPADFDSAREQVIANFVRHHAADLYQRHGDRLFERQPLHIDATALAQIVATGLPQAEISAEALDRLLEAL